MTVHLLFSHYLNLNKNKNLIAYNYTNIPKKLKLKVSTQIYYLIYDVLL